MWPLTGRNCVSFYRLGLICNKPNQNLKPFFPSTICWVIRFVIIGILERNWPVGWGCRIHRLHLCKWVRPHLNNCPGYATKQSDDEVPIMQEVYGMRSNPSLPSLPGPLCPGVVAPDRVLSMDQIERNCVLMLNWIVWNRTVHCIKIDLALNGVSKVGDRSRG